METIPLHKINPAMPEIEVKREVLSTSSPLPRWGWSHPSRLQLHQTADQCGWGCPEPGGQQTSQCQNRSLCTCNKSLHHIFPYLITLFAFPILFPLNMPFFLQRYTVGETFCIHTHLRHRGLRFLRELCKLLPCTALNGLPHWPWAVLPQAWPEAGMLLGLLFSECEEYM